MCHQKVTKITSSYNNTNISEFNVKIKYIAELKDHHSSGEKNWILTDIADHTQLGSPKRLDDKRRMMESFGTCSDGSVDDRMRRIQQQLEEMEIRAQESDRRAEESDRSVGQLQRELAVVSQSLQGKTKEVQLARQQQRESEKHLLSPVHWSYYGRKHGDSHRAYAYQPEGTASTGYLHAS